MPLLSFERRFLPGIDPPHFFTLATSCLYWAALDLDRDGHREASSRRLTAAGVAAAFVVLTDWKFGLLLGALLGTGQLALVYFNRSRRTPWEGALWCFAVVLCDWVWNRETLTILGLSLAALIAAWVAGRWMRLQRVGGVFVVAFLLFPYFKQDTIQRSLTDVKSLRESCFFDERLTAAMRDQIPSKLDGDRRVKIAGTRGSSRVCTLFEYELHRAQPALSLFPPPQICRLKDGETETEALLAAREEGSLKWLILFTQTESESEPTETYQGLKKMIKGLPPLTSFGLVGSPFRGLLIQYNNKKDH